MNRGLTPAEHLCGMVDNPKCVRKEGPLIRLNWFGVSTNNNVTIQFAGRGMKCDGGLLGGIEQHQEGCRTLYNMCNFGSTGGDCLLRCQLHENQVTQPIDITVLIAAEDNTELCGIEMNLYRPMLKHGRSALPDWNAFLSAVGSLN